MRNWKNLLGASLCALAMAAGATGAQATEGYFVEGASARDQALAGAGSANPAEALTIVNNPAGLVDVGRQFNGDISLFEPWRGYDATGTMLTAPGHVSSYRDQFPIPAIGYSQPMSPDASFGLAMTANGGMDTSYASSTFNPNCARFGSPAQGVFCGGRTGVDLNQALIFAAYAQRFGNLSIGIAPVLGVQVFSAYGLGAFSMFGLSSSPGNVSDRSPSYSYGIGVRAGALYHVNEQWSLSVQGSSPIWMSKFPQYSGLFANYGDFDIPGTIGAGVAYKFLPTLAFMFDYKHIFYSGVASIANPMAPILPASLGTPNGPGFGWGDVDVFAVGVEWRALDNLTLRAGYAYNTQPITASNVMINILAPAVTTSHIGAGFGWNYSPNASIDFSALWSPRTSVSGQEYVPGFGYNPYSNIKIYLEELQLTLGWNYRWGAPPPVVIAKY